MSYPVSELPVAFAVDFDRTTRKEVFSIVDYTPDELRNLVQFFVNRLTYQEAAALPDVLNSGTICADGATGDQLKGQAHGLKGKYV